MIISIVSSLPTFKGVTFHEGLNVLLADAHPGSTDKQTRNSAGKTSLIEIIHFLHGADCDPDSIFRLPELEEHTFTATLLIRGDKFVVSRTGSDPSKVFIAQGGENHPSLPRKFDKKSERDYVANTQWRVFLGHVMFGLPSEPESTPYGKSYAPSFRSMFSYFARRRNSGGFLRPELQAEKQQRWDWQVNLSCLLGLDWEIPYEFHMVRAREKTLEELKKAAKTGAFGQVLGTVAALRPQVALAEKTAAQLREKLVNFEVLDSYKELSRRAARAKTDMQSAGREIVQLNETLQHLEHALAQETPPERSDLQQLYAAAGVELPGVALRRFEEVGRFYESIIENRRVHLQQEIADVRDKIAKRENRMKVLDSERSDTLRMLEGRGALEDFVRLQRELADHEAAAASLRERFKAAGVIEGETTQLSIDRGNLKRRLQEDHQQRKAALDQAIVTIAEIISELYGEREGRFIVEATDNGPEFHISIEGDRGGGISNIEIFCLDLALFKLVKARYGVLDILVHDSHLFDGVDERQIATALLLGARATQGDSRQYIVTMNSDVFNGLPLSEEIDRDKVVVPTRLSDQTETGGLFGFRFG